MLDAITGNAEIESRALDRLRELAPGPRVKAAAAPPVVDWAALLGYHFAPQKAFPATIDIWLLEGNRHRDVKANVPERRIHNLGSRSLNQMAEALATKDKRGESEAPSPFLTHGRRISYATRLLLSGVSGQGPANLEVHIDHRWGQVRACTVIDKARPGTVSLMLFDPHPPLVSHPGPESVTSSAFMSRLPIERWYDISSQLPSRDLANLRATGKAMWPFQSAVDAPKVMRDGVNRLENELRTGKPELTLRQLASLRDAFDAPSVSASEKEEALNRLRPRLQVYADVKDEARLNVLIEYWPRQAKALALKVLQEDAEAPALPEWQRHRSVPLKPDLT